MAGGGGMRHEGPVSGSTVLVMLMLAQLGLVTRAAPFLWIASSGMVTGGAAGKCGGGGGSGAAAGGGQGLGLQVVLHSPGLHLELRVVSK